MTGHVRPEGVHDEARFAELIAAVAISDPTELTAAITAALRTEDVVVKRLAARASTADATVITPRGAPRPTVVWTFGRRTKAGRASMADVAALTALISGLLLARQRGWSEGPSSSLVIRHGDSPHVRRETWRSAIPETTGVIAVQAGNSKSIRIDHVLLTVVGRTAWVGAQHRRPHINAVSEMRHAIRAVKQADPRGWSVSVSGILGGFTKEFLLTRPAQHADHCTALLRVNPASGPARASASGDPVIEIGEVVSRALSPGAVVTVVPAEVLPVAAWASGLDLAVLSLHEHIRRKLDTTGHVWPTWVQIRSGASDVVLQLPIGGVQPDDIDRRMQIVASLMSPPAAGGSRDSIVAPAVSGPGGQS